MLADAAGAPLPMLVSLRDVDARDRSRGFADRVLDAAVKDIPRSDRPLVRGALERGLESGATALLLDSLDETHDRRGAVVSEVEQFCAQVSEDVPVLLATRDIAYAQAATLGWDDLRLLEPQKPEHAVRAVLEAAAAARHVQDRVSWVQRRVEWVVAILDQDHAVGETPLTPVLLALLAADRGDGSLPATRAEILHGVVEAAVRRREAHRDHKLRVATLDEHESADAALAGFAVEAGVLGDSGGEAPAAIVHDAIAIFLARDWGLPVGAASSGARAIVHFWDEIGIFVIGGGERIAPRTEVFLDIGDAVRSSTQPPEAVAAWVETRIRDRRHEPLILASALSEVVGERLLIAACGRDQHELLIAAAAAVRQHARVSDTDRERLVAALASDAQNPDAQGWFSYVALLGLLGGHRTAQDLGTVLVRYPQDHQIIGKAAMALRCSPDPVDERLLLDALTIRRLPRLPSRQTASGSSIVVASADDLHEEVVEEAARMLLGRSEEATGLVVELLQEAGMALYERLHAALRDAGLIEAARDIFARLSRALARTFSWLKDYDGDGPVRLLDHLAQHPRAELTAIQAARLDELADLYETLQLHYIAGYPRREEYDSWLQFVDVIAVLGGFDPARLAAEAELARRRLAMFGNEAFTALRIAARPRRLDHWHRFGDPGAAAGVLVEALFMGKWTAQISAAALAAAPPNSAIPLLEQALPQLKSSRDHQRLAAHAYAHLKGDEPLTGWATSNNPGLRLVAAERLPGTVDGQLNSLLCQLTFDPDRYVAVAAVRSVADARTMAAAEHLKNVVNAQREEWTCGRCGSSDHDTTDNCASFHTVLPDPVEVAREMLVEITSQS